MSASAPAVPDRFAVLVPVKPPAFAKSRLADLGDAARRELATAFAVDTVSAALASPVVDRVLVVTDDHELARGLADLGVDVIPDGTTDDLNETLRLAAAEMHRRDPDLRLVALCADLPALRPDELAVALAAAPHDGMAFVADAEGVGTTAVVASAPETFRPRVRSRLAAVSTSTRARTRSTGSTYPPCGATSTTATTWPRRVALGVGPRTSLVATLHGL